MSSTTHAWVGSYQRDSKLNLQELARVFGGSVHATRKRRGKVILWEGFFGFGDGPQVCAEYTTERHFSGHTMRATRSTIRKSLVGIPLSRQKSQFIESGVPGKDMTALAVYLTVLTGKEKIFTPAISMPYTGGLLDEPEYGSVRMVNPFGICGVQLNGHARNNLRDDEPALFFDGRVHVTGDRNTALPTVMEAQQVVFAKLGLGNVFAEIETIYGGASKHVGEVWELAMKETNAARAAQIVLGEL
jgi:hypothetical protein